MEDNEQKTNQDIKSFFKKLMQSEPVEKRDSLDLAVEDACLILEYIAHKGIIIEEDIIKTLTEGKYLHETKTWTQETEVKFWSAYQTISERIKPVTIESIKSARDDYGASIPFLLRPFALFMKQKHLSSARISVLRYSALGITFLFLIIIVQIYWLTGTSLVNENMQLTQQLDSLSLKQWELKNKRIKNEGDSLNMRIIDVRLEESKDKLAANFEYLWNWNDNWNEIATLGFYESQEDEVMRKAITAITDQKRRASTLSYSVGFPLKVVQMYVLPILYGFLGACAYVLRMLSLEIQQMTFSTDDNTSYNLRIQLGALSGLVIHWFIIPTGQNEIDMILTNSNFFIFALSFLGGYSIELVFAAMDRFIIAFSGGTKVEGK